MFWSNRVFINKKHQYLNNEILVRYLKLDTQGLEELYEDLRYMLPRLAITTDMSKIVAQRDYNDRVRDVQKILSKIDGIYLALPPYDVCQNNSKSYGYALYRTLNIYNNCGLFENGIEPNNYSTVTIYPDSNEYGYLTYRDDGKEVFYLTRFNLMSMRELWDNKAFVDEIVEDLEAINKSIKAIVAPYIHWLESVLRVQYVYAKLIDEFYHIRHGFLDEPPSSLRNIWLPRSWAAKSICGWVRLNHRRSSMRCSDRRAATVGYGSCYRIGSIPTIAKTHWLMILAIHAVMLAHGRSMMTSVGLTLLG